MENATQVCVTIPGDSQISPFYDQVQDNTLIWARKFRLAPDFKPVEWYMKARFGFQAAREYPQATLDQVTLAGQLLTWLFTLDDTSDRGSTDKTAAHHMRLQLDGFIGILNNQPYNGDGKLERALVDIVTRLKAMNKPFLFKRFCEHMIDYVRECQFEIETQLSGKKPDIEKYYKERPYTGFYIMFPLVDIFNSSALPDEVYDHPVVREMELCMNMCGCLSNDQHSVAREDDMEEKGFNLILIARREKGISLREANEFVEQEHARYLRTFEQCRDRLPFWNETINRQLNDYLSGLYRIVRGYDDWAVTDTGRYAS
ncbi:terpene synthase family protein [Chitinophaga flava]|uniref:Terpene synthase n=1 Tax=Chitinophaga flava TaxID=2259036 RepID=A0A365XUU5_9BACT|nr:hypothetical protein [Chitinophaga flava]RBL90119.1 hypothetical protein DF182_27005 [Chitinophaga flava]